ncbi:hypothetical protein CKO38_05355 [Rhodospirillum rubrum]|uniref:ABC transporter permease n=1 Tax=Rhodospirillum rubrum TaxID=1085 RepID=UPI001903720D|nr:FtsX-like permease family protein [Rhodospirillum rubrum]MBK1664920.1 hypothetical protein [Rhodospirillum rubrum]MBK1676109.1 hypothetical protein [Rhodospirillum rubrum]
MFALKVARRYLLSNPGQTLLLIAGVALGVIVFVFITGLIGGLRVELIAQTVGNLPHVTLEAKALPPREALASGETAKVLAAVEKTLDVPEQIRSWSPLLGIVEATPGVRVASPQIIGNAFATRGRASAALTLTGVLPERLSAIADIAGQLVAGEARLDLDSLLIGDKLADKLGLRIGSRLVLRADTGTERSFLIQGIFRTGVEALDERTAYLHLRAARTLLDLPYGISKIEIKLARLDDAEVVASHLGAATGLTATSWIAKNRRLYQALASQAQTGRLIQGFSLITIVIGVSSALLLSTYRRRSEIGIMRSFGVSKRFVALVFLAQGLFVGLIGALLGASAGYGFCQLLVNLARRPDGTPALPIDPSQGGYLAVISLTVLGSVLAAVIPARNAAAIDPVEVIG